jgi:hypothetical protein
MGLIESLGKLLEIMRLSLLIRATRGRGERKDRQGEKQGVLIVTRS